MPGSLHSQPGSTPCTSWPASAGTRACTPRRERRSAGLDRCGGAVRMGARWCGWGSCGGPGRAVVQICCKGPPGRDRPREEPRNINDSHPALRRDGGLCNRFGQTAPPRAPGGAPRAGRRPRRAPRSAGRAHGSVRRSRHRTAATARPSPLGAPGRRDVHFALESAVPTVILECKTHISSAKCTSRRGSGPTPSRQPRTATARTDPRRPRPADHDSRRESRSPGPSEPTRAAGRTGSSALPRTGVLRVP